MSRVTAIVDYADPDPDEYSDWQHNAWRVQLRYEGRRMTVTFKTGLALSEPTARDVIECLLSDASSVSDGQDFEEWASEFGYDTDSRKAEATYRATVSQTERLRRLLGDDYEQAVSGDHERAARRLTA